MSKYEIESEPSINIKIGDMFRWEGINGNATCMLTIEGLITLDGRKSWLDPKGGFLEYIEQQIGFGTLKKLPTNTRITITQE